MSTNIEWCNMIPGRKGITWNPVTGCTPVSRGCDHCYARTMAETRLRGRCGYPADEPFRVTLHPGRLDEPATWRNPRLVFVCSMGDLFHEHVPDSFIDEVMCRISFAEQHLFLILTKRPERMRNFFFSWHCYEYGGDPLSNLWLGTSVEDQTTADQRIPDLLATPAAVRFVSYEPALGPVDFGKACGVSAGPPVAPNWSWFKNRGINWLIMGGESGPGATARKMHPQWALDVRDQCQAAGVPFFFKQWGTFPALGSYYAGYNPRAKKGGRILDGRTHDDYPGAAG